MKDRLRELVEGAPPAARRHVAREYVQHYILYALFRTRHHQDLAFTGGTALRVLHDLPRFSEDLDFSLAPDSRAVEFATLRQDVMRELTMAGYEVTEKVRDRANVVSTFIRFPGLPHDLGLSPHRDEALSVRIELDMNPPAGAATEQTTVNRYHLLYYVRHYDLPTLFAGKLHALLFRRYAKGRDLYDLLWFLTAKRDTQPNLAFLNEAAAQTRPAPPGFAGDNWRSLVLERLRGLEIARLRQEVRVFLERPEEADLLALDHFERLLAG